MKNTLIMTVGLPRSGKSTYFRDKGFPIVCPDEIRKHFECLSFTKHMEPLVWWIAHLMVEVLFASGARTVVLDATNTTYARRQEWRKPEQWRRLFYLFDTPPQVCEDRALANHQGYLVDVIKRMHRDMEKDQKTLNTMPLDEGEHLTIVREDGTIQRCEA